MTQNKKELLERQLVELKLMHDIVRITCLADSTDEALQKCLDTICKFIGWPVGHIYDYNVDESILVPTSIWYLSKKFEKFVDVTKRTKFKPGVGLPGRVYESGEPAFIINVLDDNNFPRAKLADDIGIRGAYGFPIRIKGKIVSIMEFFSEKPIKPDETLLNILKGVSDQLGLVFEQKVLHENHKKLYQAVEQSSSNIVITDANGNIEYVNPMFTTLTGYSFQEIIGKNPSFLKSGKTNSKEYETLWANISSGKDWRGVFCNKKKNGELYYESAVISPVKDDSGRIINFVAVKDDITKKKEVEYALINSQNTLTNIINCTTEMIVTVNMENKINTWNKAIESKTGFRKNQLNNMDIDSLPKELNGIVNCFKETIKKMNSVNSNFKIYNKEGISIEIHAQTSITKSQDGNINEIILIGKDMTEKIQVDKNLIPGNSYISTEKQFELLIDNISKLEKKNYLFITRGDISVIQNKIINNISYIMMSAIQKNGEEYEFFEKIISDIREYLAKNDDAVIVINKLSYIYILFEFNKMLHFLYSVNDLVKKYKSIAVIHTDPDLFKNQEITLLRDEFKIFPSVREPITLDQKKRDIIKFIHGKNSSHINVTASIIAKEFNLSRMTIYTWLKDFEQNGFIEIKHVGSSKNISILGKAKSIILECV